MAALLVLLISSLISLATSKLFGDCGDLSSSCATTSTSVSSEEYLTLSAKEKNQIIFDNVLANATSADWFSSSEMPGIFIESMCPVFQAKGDELPWEKNVLFYHWRNKYIHSVGTVGQVELRNLGNHPYTGLFEGASQGIVRLSFATKPDPASNVTTPGMGLKLLRDGMDSANLVAMVSVDGQEGWNFFKTDFSNHIPPAGPALIPLATKFSTATTNIGQVGLSDFGRYGELGNKVVDPKFPFKLRFHPTGDIQFPENYVRPFTDLLTCIAKGSTLYEVWAMDKPIELGGTEIHIADLVLVSDMVTSVWGDTSLFFRHQDMAEDIAIRPEWKNYLDTFGVEFLSGCPVGRHNRAGRAVDN